MTPLASFVEQQGGLSAGERIVAEVALSSSLQILLATMKQSGFAEEEEWRAIYPFEPGPEIVHFRTSARGVVPYVELAPTPAGARLPIAEVVAGPRVSDAAANTAEFLLRTKGYKTLLVSDWAAPAPGGDTVAIRRSRTQYV